MLAEVVVAVVDDSKLSSVLSAIHGAGLGHVARGIRSKIGTTRTSRGTARSTSRGDMREQLRHNGIPVEQLPGALEGEERLLVVNAAARSSSTADLMLQHGATAVWIVSPAGGWIEIDDRAETVMPVAGLVAEQSALGAPTNADRLPRVAASAEIGLPADPSPD